MSKQTDSGDALHILFVLIAIERHKVFRTVIPCNWPSTSPSLDTLRLLGLVFASAVGKNPVPVGHRTAEKHDDPDEGDQRDDELHLPEP